MKIISYVEMKADNFKANISNTQLSVDFSQELNPEQYEFIEEFKKNNLNIVKCISLEDIKSFSLTVKPTEEEYKIFEESGFVVNGTDKYGNDFYVRKELLE